MEDGKTDISLENNESFNFALCTKKQENFNDTDQEKMT